MKNFSRVSSARLLVGGQFEPPTDNKTVRRRRAAAAIARQGDPKGEAEGRIIRPGEPIFQKFQFRPTVPPPDSSALIRTADSSTGRGDAAGRPWETWVGVFFGGRDGEDRFAFLVQVLPVRQHGPGLRRRYW